MKLTLTPAPCSTDVIVRGTGTGLVGEEEEEGCTGEEGDGSMGEGLKDSWSCSQGCLVSAESRGGAGGCSSGWCRDGWVAVGAALMGRGEGSKLGACKSGSSL